MAYVYRITIDRDLINEESRGIDLLEPGGWISEPIAFDKERGLHVEVVGGTSRLVELFVTHTVLRYHTLYHVNVQAIEFWTFEPIPLDLDILNPPRDWVIEFIREEN